MNVASLSRDACRFVGNGSSKAEHAVLEIWMKYNYLQKALKNLFLFYKLEDPVDQINF